MLWADLSPLEPRRLRPSRTIKEARASVVDARAITSKWYRGLSVECLNYDGLDHELKAWLVACLSMYRALCIPVLMKPVPPKSVRIVSAFGPDYFGPMQHAVVAEYAIAKANMRDLKLEWAESDPTLFRMGRQKCKSSR